MEREILSAALVGYTKQREEILSKIQELEDRLSSLAAPTVKRRQSHRLSPEGRARIVAALKRRWSGVKIKKAS